MKRTVFAGLSLVLLLSGCATEEYVRQQTTPISDRLGVLEAKISSLDGKVNQLAAKPNITPDELKNLDDLRSMSQRALEEVKNLSNEMKQLGADVARAEEAAKRAEAAAEKAGRAEKNAKKAFELGQKK